MTFLYVIKYLKGPGGSVVYSVLGSWPKSCEIDAGSRQLLGERSSTLSLTQAELYSLYLPSLGELFNHL